MGPGRPPWRTEVGTSLSQVRTGQARDPSPTDVLPLIRTRECRTPVPGLHVSRDGRSPPEGTVLQANYSFASESPPGPTKATVCHLSRSRTRECPRGNTVRETHLSGTFRDTEVNHPYKSSLQVFWCSAGTRSVTGVESRPLCPDLSGSEDGSTSVCDHPPRQFLVVRLLRSRGGPSLTRCVPLRPPHRPHTDVRRPLSPASSPPTRPPPETPS